MIIITISRFSAFCLLRSMMAVVPNVSTMETVVAASVIRNLFQDDTLRSIAIGYDN